METLRKVNLHTIFFLIVALSLLSYSLSACDDGDDGEDDPSTGSGQADEDDDNDNDEALTCPEPTGDVLAMEPRMYFEYQSTDNDTGIHGLMGGIDWAQMCITMPDGTPFMAVKPQASLHDFGVADLFFESREPEASEVSMEEVLEKFAAGEYRVVGKTFDGKSFESFAHVTHDIANPPVILAPADEAEVDWTNVVVEWEEVTHSVFGDPVTISGYEIIVTNEDRAEGSPDPHGMSLPAASIHVRPDVRSLTIPPEFFEPNTLYELEVIAIEESGNQTITVHFFETLD